MPDISELYTCPRCHTPNFTKRGLTSHVCRKNDRQTLPKAEVEAVIGAGTQGNNILAIKGAKPLTLERMDEMPSAPSPTATRNLKDMTLAELEAADRGLRALPERLEKMSGICAVLNGLILTEIKGRLEHKQWTPWLKDHYGKAVRTAQKYMQIAGSFTKSATRGAFEPHQLTLALLDDTQSGALDLAHPVVVKVEEWADGRSFRQLIAEETGDGRATNKGGFKPNLTLLRGWLRDNYAEHDDLESWMEAQFFELPEEIQKRYLAEGKRYEERLPKEAREELANAEAARGWNGSAPGMIHEWQEAAHFQRANKEQLTALEQALADLLSEVRRHIREKK
jgi:hypothetical protein